MTREIPQIFIPMRYRSNRRLRNMHKFKETESYKEKGFDAHSCYFERQIGGGNGGKQRSEIVRSTP